jgi:hypothetical protein
VVRRSETEGDSQKNDSAAFWKLHEGKESVSVGIKISRKPLLNLTQIARARPSVMRTLLT